jgi:hypothetical protein
MRSIFHQQLWGIAMTGRQLAAPFVEPRASLIQVVSCLLRATAGLLSCYSPRIHRGFSTSPCRCTSCRCVWIFFMLSAPIMDMVLLIARRNVLDSPA